MNPVKSIIAKAVREDNEPINVLTYPTHERYQSNLADCNAIFYMLQGTPGVKENGWVENFASMPKNHILLPKSQDPLSVIPPGVEIHCTLSQHRFGQWQTSEQISRLLHIPHINIEHTWPMSFWSDDRRQQLRKLNANINLFISPQSRDAWGWDSSNAQVILHGVNTELFKTNPNINKKLQVLSVVNDWINRGNILGFDIWKRVVPNNFSYLVRGNTPGLSTMPQNVHELIQNYNESTVFFNTSLQSPIPSTLLEAMACGLPIVTTDNCLISDVIVDGHNGFKTNDESVMREKVKWLLNNPEQARILGENARNDILQRFSLDKFTENWNNILQQAATMRYLPNG